MTIFPCAFSRWSPVIGDNHPVGWLTVAVYLLATVACARTALGTGFTPLKEKREQAFWWLATSLMAFLAVNKQIDLQSLLTAVARCAALDQGWYEDRQAVQRGFIIGLIAGGVAGILLASFLLQGTFARTGLALIGLTCVSVFVGIRAVSFHQVDALIGMWVLGLRMNWLLELPGPILVIWAAFRASRPRRLRSA